jgi:Fur family zinc uptake transcriptional regulator
LEQEHFVHKLLLANKYVACSQINCAKTHEASQFYICSRCGKVKEVAINSEAFEELKRDSVEAGFDIDAPQLEINCVCTECC